MKRGNTAIKSSIISLTATTQQWIRDYVSGLVQQYSSANFVSLCFICQMKKFGADFKNVIRLFTFFKKLLKPENS